MCVYVHMYVRKCIRAQKLLPSSYSHEHKLETLMNSSQYFTAYRKSHYFFINIEVNTSFSPNCIGDNYMAMAQLIGTLLRVP